MKMTSIAGSPAVLTASPPPQPPRCSTQVRLLTFRDLPIFTPMAHFPPVGHMDTVGDRSVWGLAGHHSRMGNGSWIPVLAGLGPAISRGAGLPITMEDGSSIPPAAAGFIPRRFSTDTPGILSVREGGFPRASIPRDPSIVR